MSLKFVLSGAIDNKFALDWVMAWYRTDDKPQRLSPSSMTEIYICVCVRVTWPQCDNQDTFQVTRSSKFTDEYKMIYINYKRYLTFFYVIPEVQLHNNHHPVTHYLLGTPYSGYWSTGAKVMACSVAAPSQNLNRCWIRFLWKHVRYHLSKSYFLTLLLLLPKSWWDKWYNEYIYPRRAAMLMQHWDAMVWPVWWQVAWGYTFQTGL